jgi:type II secretory pathway predicted ATPase ExeA
MLIERTYGMTTPPFGLVSDPRFFFASRTHARAAAFLEFGLQQGMGFVVLTGDVGVGKSTVLAHLLDGLAPAEVEIASLTSSNLDPLDVLKRALGAFDVPTDATTKADLLRTFESYLDELVRVGRRALLIIDEAQNIPDVTLEELRMLTNIRREDAFPFQCFFVGQPQFRARLENPDMEQLRQRVIASYHVEALAEEEVRAYVEHRLNVAGWTGRPTFDPALFAAAHRITRGVPRRLNVVFNRLLLVGALDEREWIGVDDLDAVLEDLRGEVVSVEAPEAAAATPVAALPAPSAACGAAASGGDAARLEALRARVDELETLVLDLVETVTRLIEPARPEPGRGERDAPEPAVAHRSGERFG